MDVALVSVVASSVVALAALISQALSGRGQRKHELQLAYEARVWDRKSDALYLAIKAAREANDALVSRHMSGSSEVPEDATKPETWERARHLNAVRVVETLLELSTQVSDSGPIIEAFGSDQVRQDLLVLRRELRRPNWNRIDIDDVRIAEEEMNRGAETADTAAFRNGLATLREAARRVHDDLVVSDGLEAAIASFIESARLSMRESS